VGLNDSLELKRLCDVVLGGMAVAPEYAIRCEVGIITRRHNQRLGYRLSGARP